MKDHDPLSSQVTSRLCGPLPESDPRPGFETRLLTTIQSASAARPALWPRITGLASAAIALLVLALVLIRQDPPNPSAAASSPPAARPVLAVPEFSNPLESETVAVRTTVDRAGRFLLSQLPGLPESGKTL